MRFRNSLRISAIWLIPVVFVIIESIIFLPKALRNNSFVPYFAGFWFTRALLAPFIAFYTFRFWVEYNKVLKIFFIHLLGFLLFSLLFWTISFLLLRNVVSENAMFGIERTSTNLGVFGLLVDNSLSTNIIVYAST